MVDFSQVNPGFHRGAGRLDNLAGLVQLRELRTQQMLLAKEAHMPVELVWLGGILVVVAGILVGVLISRSKPAEPTHLK